LGKANRYPIETESVSIRYPSCFVWLQLEVKANRQPSNTMARTRTILVAKVFGWRSSLKTPTCARAPVRDVYGY
jgi:hypothetical protein